MERWKTVLDRHRNTNSADLGASGLVHLEVLDGVLVALALLNWVQRHVALQVPVDPDVDVLASRVVRADLDEVVHAGNHLALEALGVEVAQLPSEFSLYVGLHLVADVPDFVVDLLGIAGSSTKHHFTQVLEEGDSEGSEHFEFQVSTELD